MDPSKSFPGFAGRGYAGVIAGGFRPGQEFRSNRVVTAEGLGRATVTAKASRTDYSGQPVTDQDFLEK